MLILAFLSAAATAPAVVAPTGPWKLDYAVHQCVAQREFAAPEGQVSLLLKPSPTSDVLQINLVTNEPKQIASESETILTIDETQPVSFKQLRFNSGKLTFRQINLPGDFAARLEHATRISWAGRGTDLHFNTGSMAKLLKELNACRESLREYWNIGINRRANFKSHVTPLKPIQSLFDSRDYPRQSSREGSQGTAFIIVLIDERGLVRDCMLDVTSGFAIIDAMTCAVITERGKFKPAIGADGKPVRASFMQRVHWVLPK